MKMIKNIIKLHNLMKYFLCFKILKYYKMGKIKKIAEMKIYICNLKKIRMNFKNKKMIKINKFKLFQNSIKPYFILNNFLIYKLRI